MESLDLSRLKIMQTIETKYLGATNTKGDRIKAINSGKSDSVLLDYDHGMTPLENHEKAAGSLFNRLGWTGGMVGGATSTGMVWVFEHSSGSPRLDLDTK